MLKGFLLMPLLVCCLLLHGQQPDNCHTVLSGVVYDSTLNTPLIYATIETGDGTFSASTDNHGRFRITGLCPGKYELQISHLACEHRHLQLWLTRDTMVVIFLPHYSHLLEGASVSGARPSATVGKLSVQQLQLSKGSTISDLMAGISGITLMKTGSSVTKPVINGLQGNRVVILNNGIRQEGQQWGAEHAPEIDAFMATNIELIKGADALRYGSDGIGGTILVNPEPVFVFKPKKLQGEFNTVGATNGRMGAISAYAGSRISDKIPLYWRVQGTLKQSGNIKAPHYFVDNTGYKETNYSVTLGYDHKRFRTELFYSHFNTHIGIFTGSHVGNLTDLQRAFERDTPYLVRGFSYTINNPRQEVQHSLLKSRTEVYLNAQNSLVLTYALQDNHRQEFDIKRNPNNPFPDFNYSIQTHTMDLSWERKKFHGWQHTAGINGIYQRNAYEGRFFIPGYYNKGASVYGISKYTYKRWSFESGLRYDIRNLTAYYYKNNVLLSPAYLYTHPSGTLAVTFRQKRSWIHTLILSQTWRAPAANELYSNGLHLSVAALEVGDSSIRPETSRLASINTTAAAGKFTLDAEAYYKYIHNFINLVPSLPPQLTVRGAFPVFRYVQTNASITGINLSAMYKIHRNWFVRDRTNILWGKDLANHRYLNQMPPVKSTITFGYSRKDWFVNLSVIASLKQYRYELNSDYVAPPKGYAIASVDVGNTFFIRQQPFKLSLSVTNALNAAYRDYLNRFRYYTDEQGRNITLRLTVPINQLSNKSIK